MVAIELRLYPSLLIVDDEERVSSTLRQSLSRRVYGIFESFGISRKTRSTVTKRARRNQGKGRKYRCSNFYSLGFLDKLDRFESIRLPSH